MCELPKPRFKIDEPIYLVGIDKNLREKGYISTIRKTIGIDNSGKYTYYLYSIVKVCGEVDINGFYDEDLIQERYVK